MSENQEKMQSENVGKLFEALSKAQGKIESALKDKKNPFYKSNYADLASVWEACRGPLSENGLCVVQTTAGTKTDPFLITHLGHASGEWIKSHLPLMLVKSDPQGMGSALTYARRYALSAIVGVCQEDDDGNRACRSEKPKQQESVQQRALTQKVEEPEPIITMELEKELLSMLNQDESFKETVFNFLMNTLGKNNLSELPYKDFQKIYHRTKKHLEEKKNDTAKSAIIDLETVAQE